MRNEKEMLALLVKVAKEDTRIVGAYMNGSRTNPIIKKDIFQDYDVVYVVKDTASFIEDKEWINIFGERLYLSYPETNIFFPSDPENCYGWLIQLSDGNRIDLHVETLEYTLEHGASDSLYQLLYDETGKLPKSVISNDQDYWIKKPTQEEFECTYMEFWWCLNNIAKGLWREEVVYVQDQFVFLRTELFRMLSWYFGVHTEFKKSAGKSGKLMSELIPLEYERYIHTFSSCELKALWGAVIIMIDLFDDLTNTINSEFDFKYDKNQAINSRAFLLHVKELAKDAKEIY